MERLEERRLLSGSIAGNVWWDGNGNGLQDPGELPRVTGSVYIDSNNSGTYDAGEPLTFSDASGHYQFATLSPGSYTVRHLVPSGSVLSNPTPQSQFNIDLSFADDIPEAIRTGIEQAAQRWMQIVVGDLPDQDGVDDLHIDVVSGELPETILATGGPDQFRSGSDLPYHGVITWAQLALGESTARATEIGLHEIAHVLGFGTMWQDKKLIETQLGAPVYTGQAAVAMYKFAVDSAAKSVPVEPDAGDSTDGSHWANSWAAVNGIFDVMASKLDANETGRFISTVTVGAIADLGYEVNFAQADLDWAATKGKYREMRHDAPVGVDGKSYLVTIDGDEAEAGLDFGIKGAAVNFPTGPKPVITGTLSGVAFVDLNHNGRKDRGDKNLVCTIFFDVDKDGVLDATEPRIKIKTGSYKFTGIPVGTYRLKVILPKGMKLGVAIKTLKMTVATLKQKVNIVGVRG
jgi:hypothetical protein